MEKKKKYRFAYFFKLIKYIKFQDPSIKSVTEGWTGGQDRTNMPHNFFQVGGTKNMGPVIFYALSI